MRADKTSGKIISYIIARIPGFDKFLKKTLFKPLGICYDEVVFKTTFRNSSEQKLAIAAIVRSTVMSPGTVLSPTEAERRTVGFLNDRNPYLEE